MLRAVAFGVLPVSILASSGGAAAPGPTRVSLPFGQVYGNSLASVDEFLGIPYALPPVGIRRFAPPEPWAGSYPSGHLDAKRPGAACMQPQKSNNLIWFYPGIVPVSEDCLFLNIWRPKAAPQGNASNASDSQENQTAAKPVMLFIHGGSLQSGSGSMPSYNGTELVAQEDVLVVTFNYRLNAFGFSPVVTPSGTVANNGWRDQREAMRWVRQHIAAFGGDPARVTVFGQSAGGQSILAHILSPGSAGLFDGAILQSGDIDLMSPLDYGLDVTKKIAQRVGCQGAADLACLRSVPAWDLVDVATRLEPPAVIDGDFLPGAPMQLLEEGKFNKGIPIIMGWNLFDAKLFTYPGFHFPSDEGSLLTLEQTQCTLRRGLGQEKAAKLMEVYPPRRTYGIFDNRGLLGEMSTDVLFACPNSRAAAAVAAHNGSAWAYSFRREPTCSPLIYPGPVHGAELAFVFGNQEKMAAFYRHQTWSHCTVAPQDKALSQTMMRLWGDFARQGAPPAAWPQWSADAQPVLKLELASSLSRLSVETGFRKGQCEALTKAGLQAATTYIGPYLALPYCQDFGRRLSDEEEKAQARRAPSVFV